jgi:hypothetical protein
VDELLAERDVQLEELTADPARHRAEAVQIPDATGGAVQVDRVPASEEACHHRLGDAGGEAGGDRCIRGGAALGKDRGSGLSGGGMAGCDRRARRPLEL